MSDEKGKLTAELDNKEKAKNAPLAERAARPKKRKLAAWLDNKEKPKNAPLAEQAAKPKKESWQHGV